MGTQVAPGIDTPVAVPSDGGHNDISRLKLLDEGTGLDHLSHSDVPGDNKILTIGQYGFLVFQEQPVAACEGDPSDPDQDLIRIRGLYGYIHEPYHTF